MATVATPQLRALAQKWRSECGYPSAVVSGIVGDLRHAKAGGYHISRQDQPKSNYSVVRPEDRPGNGPDDAAAAIDMTMSRADMVKCTNRLITVFRNTADPRRKYLNAFNGWTGVGEAQRWDVYARTQGPATADHKWHVHLELRRLYVTSDTAVKAVASALAGESVNTYLVSIGVVSAAVKKAPPYPGRILRRNESARADPAVKAFQAQMLRRGWASVGKADGFFGPKLEDVVKRWQKTAGLPVDGMIGPKTWPTPWTRPVGK